MIKRQDLLDAISECQGERNPNANTCMKLSAYYILMDKLYPEEAPVYSRAEPGYNSGSEFSEAIWGLNPEEVYRVMDELMEAVSIIVPKLYRATLDKLRK